MSDQLREKAKSQLASLVQRVLADGHIDDSEREDMQNIFRQAVLTVSDVQGVFSKYLKGLAAEVLADGVVTDEERERCRAAVEQLRIPLRLLPPEVRDIVLKPGSGS